MSASTHWNLGALAKLADLDSSEQLTRVLELLTHPGEPRGSGDLLKMAVAATGDAHWALDLGLRLANSLDTVDDPTAVHGALLCDWLQRHPLESPAELSAGGAPVATLAIRRAIAEEMKPTPQPQERP